MSVFSSESESGDSSLSTGLAVARETGTITSVMSAEGLPLLIVRSVSFTSFCSSDEMRKTGCCRPANETPPKPSTVGRASLARDFNVSLTGAESG